MDPSALTLPCHSLDPKQNKAPRHKSGDTFLRGPVPMDWLNAAALASGSGSGFKVGIALWHLVGLNHNAKTVRLSGSMLRKMGVERHASYRGLNTLETAGLVSVERKPGQSPIVTLLSQGNRP